MSFKLSKSFLEVFFKEVRETCIFGHLCLTMLLGELPHLWLI